jgi:hypothetical protein
MFVSWILNFKDNFRKKISLQPLMKLNILIDEILFSQNMYYLHDKIIRCHRKIFGKKEETFKINFFYLNFWKNSLES